jgi:tyrosyl-tRNA synthetase
LIHLLSTHQIVSSTSEARRLIDQGAVSIDGERVSDQMFEVPADGEHVIKVGKRRFLRVRPVTES